MRRLLNMYAYALVLTILLSCDRNDEGYETTYPDILTEMADVLTDSEGRMVRMLTDKGTEYSVSNPPSGSSRRRDTGLSAATSPMAILPGCTT